ncbi:glycosyl hydrolase family 95 catalytic domain-containing protein [Bacteroides sp. 224]|uniref:glycoside hydrolase family 95 protein n=1 Tax=Bacteroides sp. 224 TaxID=2302936 RepID=UPI0013D10855|nr:glycoside hydrolase family 95 protein [Bacteroides sp. 224]NDV64265.1 glycoside hydrolase family 95 protein [Bacteroides sp. 224]
MKSIKTFAGFIGSIVLFLTGCQASDSKTNTFKFWYDQPAAEWMQSLPLGNGRIGVMVYGGIEEETLALNESTLWSGQYDEQQQRPFGRKKLDELRQLFFDGNLADGNGIAGNAMHGTAHSFGTHLPMGDLKIRFTYPEGKISQYQRELDLHTAVSKVTYRAGNVNYTRECIATNPDDAIVWNIKADKPGSIQMEISLDLLRNAEIRAEGNQLIYTGNAEFEKHGSGGVLFDGRIAVKLQDGTVEANEKTLSIKDATEVMLVADIRTNFKSTVFAGYDYKKVCKETTEKVLGADFTSLRERHIADYAPLFERVDMSLGDGRYNKLPTDKRWAQVKEGVADPDLDALFFQYARYLLIASSRPNSPLPVALQGFFNDNLACHMGWTNDYHLDINTQQNYWIANVGNLAECHTPLFGYIKDLAHHGTKVAQDLYGCKGWTAHTTANVWGYAAVSGSIAWGLFPTASSWLASHLWTQYEYTQDKKYLAEIAYPLLKSNAEFLLDYMVIDPNNGYLVTGPSISPENSFRHEGGNYCASMMPTCDRVFVEEIFSYCIKASEILGMDRPFADSLRTSLQKLPPFFISERNGGLQEWFKDYEEAHPNHRHTTHLLALYPYSQITPDKTPELAAACRKTIENRLATPDWEDTEWSRANMICMYARLRDTKEAYASLQQLLGTLTRETLLSMSPAGIAGAPYDIFIFDGNAAGAAGMAEMLIQSHDEVIDLLPCLPEQWKNGYFKGLCVKGGGEMSANWKNGKLAGASLKATADNSFTVKVPKEGKYAIFINGEKTEMTPDAKGLVTLMLKENDLVEIQ